MFSLDGFACCCCTSPLDGAFCVLFGLGAVFGDLSCASAAPPKHAESKATVKVMFKGFMDGLLEWFLVSRLLGLVRYAQTRTSREACVRAIQSAASIAPVAWRNCRCFHDATRGRRLHGHSE